MHTVESVKIVGIHNEVFINPGMVHINLSMLHKKFVKAQKSFALTDIGLGKLNTITYLLVIKVSM